MTIFQIVANTCTILVFVDLIAYEWMVERRRRRR